MYSRAARRPSGGGSALAVRRVERRAARVVGDLESAALVAGDPVEEARDLDPDGEAVLVEARGPRPACRSRRPPAASAGSSSPRSVGKDLRQPRTAREDVDVGRGAPGPSESAQRPERGRPAIVARRRRPHATRYSPPSATKPSTTSAQARRARRYPASFSTSAQRMPSKEICGYRRAASGGRQLLVRRSRCSLQDRHRGSRTYAPSSAIIQSAPVRR